MSIIYRGQTIAGTPSSQLEFQRAGYINAWVAGTTVSTATFDYDGFTGIQGFNAAYEVTEAGSDYTGDIFERVPYIDIPGFAGQYWYQFTCIEANSGAVELNEVLWSRAFDLDSSADNFIFSIG